MMVNTEYPKRLLLFITGNDAEVESSNSTIAYKTIEYGNYRSFWSGTELTAPFRGAFSFLGAINNATVASEILVRSSSDVVIIPAERLIITNYTRYSSSVFLEKGETFSVVYGNAQALIDTRENHYLMIEGVEIK